MPRVHCTLRRLQLQSQLPSGTAHDVANHPRNRGNGPMHEPTNSPIPSGLAGCEEGARGRGSPPLSGFIFLVPPGGTERGHGSCATLPRFRTTKSRPPANTPEARTGNTKPRTRATTYTGQLSHSSASKLRPPSETSEGVRPPTQYSRRSGSLPAPLRLRLA